MAAIAEYIEKLEPIAEIPFREYTENYFTKHTAERLVELIVESAVDINGLVVTGSGEPPPKDYYSSFVKMSNLGVYEESFGLEIASTAGLRNRLVHEYEEVNDRIVHQETGRVITLYRAYLKFVHEFLKG